MKIKILTLTAITAAFVVGQASAVTIPHSHYIDVDKVREKLDESNPAVDGVWNIVQSENESHSFDKHGFDNTREIVTNAAAIFVFYEQDQDGGYNADHTTVQIGSFLSAGLPDSVEVIFDSISFGSVYADILFDIQEDGKLAWEVSLSDLTKSVGLWTATLSVETKPVSDSGTTFGLLGIGIFGFVVFRRRVARQGK